MQMMALNNSVERGIHTVSEHSCSISDFVDGSNEKRHRKHSPKTIEKYGLRPRSLIKRIHVEKTRGSPSKTETKRPSKSRPPPLSKYRRKTANARERHRMKEINEAFETLRQILPDFCSRRAATTMTKITTLRLAVSYIRALSHILEEDQADDIAFFDGLQVNISFESSKFHPIPNIQDVDGFQQHSFRLEKSLESLPFSYSATTTSSNALTFSRCSLGSTSDLSDLISDDSSVLEDNLNAFDDIPALPEVDPFALLLTPEGEGFVLES